MSILSTTDDRYDALKEWAEGAAQKIGLAVLVVLVAVVCAGAAVITSSLRPPSGIEASQSDESLSAMVKAALDHAHAQGELGSPGADDGYEHD